MKTLSLTLCALLLSTPLAMAETDHATMDHSVLSAEQLASAVHTDAVVNTLGDGTANVSHEPIPEIGWPAMTMDLTVSPDVQMIGDVEAGAAVTLMLIKGDDGLYAIGAIMAQE